MTTPDLLPPDEKQQRLRATDPRVNAWVAANAGSGKTSILKNRVIRLLLAGATPDRILCLTYTKAAAAEMQNRIFAELAGWVTLDDAALDAAIGTILASDGREAGLPAEALNAARTLFARAIETPGGLKIQTIHAFAERILRLFPLESGVPLNFEILDEASTALLAEQARQAVLREAIDEPGTMLGRSFSGLVEATGLTGFAETLDAAMVHLGSLLIKDEALAAPGQRNRLLRQLLGLSPNQTRAAIDAQREAAAPDTGMMANWIERLGQINATKGSAKLVAALTQAIESLARGEPTAIWLDPLIDSMTTLKGTFSTAVLSLKQQGQLPDIMPEFLALVEAHRLWQDRHAAFTALERSEALMTFAEAVHRRFEWLKRARNALDFNDLIGALRRLVLADHAGWIMLKLDAAIDHILVDEAQDTTPDMWDILKALTEEFFAGAGSVTRPRSLFVVGDEKQSIFSFQGANPVEFEGARQHFGQREGRDDRISRPVPLNYSFRTSPDVLELVDSVFEEPAFRAGVALSAQSLDHKAAWPRFPGEAVLWPIIRPVNDDATVAGPRVPAAQQLAERIAGQIRDWIDSGACHARDGKPIRPGDILILVQQRDGFFEAMLKALKRRGLPAAGADRLKLQEHIAVQDLLVLAEAVLSPGHDLALATALRSPLLAIDDSQLEQVARGRRGSLWEAVQAEPALAPQARRLTELAYAARRLGPHAFLARVLAEPVPGSGGLTGRQALQARLGSDIHDPVDALLQEAIAFEGGEVASVLLFLLEQRRRSTQIKRDMDQSGDLVRVMTVHGAKGLEGRIVFLCDTTRRVKSARANLPLLLREEEAPLLVWLGRKARRPGALEPAFDALNQRQREESRRLFYVAMTRASDRLIIGGHLSEGPGKKDFERGEDMPLDDPDQASWYQMARDGFRRHKRCLVLPEADTGTNDGIDRRIRIIPPREALHPPQTVQAGLPQPAPGQEPDLPAWLLRPPPREAGATERLVPSRLVGPEARGSGGPSAGSDSRQTGIVVHRLFELLAGLPADQAEAAGRAWLARILPGRGEAEREALLMPVLALLGSEAARFWFGPESRAEVAIAGAVTLADGRLYPVEARLDRLVVRPGRIGLLDIKTGTRGESIATGILRQMAVYARLLAALYPGAPVEASILWTRDMVFEPLAPAALAEAFAGIRGSDESEAGIA